MSFATGLQRRECGRNYARQPLYVCENCFGPFGVMHDYDGTAKTISREKSPVATEIAVAQKLIAGGRIPRDESIVAV